MGRNLVWWNDYTGDRVGPGDGLNGRWPDRMVAMDFVFYAVDPFLDW